MSKRTDLIRCLPNLAIDQRWLSLCRCPTSPYAANTVKQAERRSLSPRELPVRFTAFGQPSQVSYSGDRRTEQRYSNTRHRIMLCVCGSMQVQRRSHSLRIELTQPSFCQISSEKSAIVAHS